MKKPFNFLANFALISQIGVTMVIPIILGVWLGGALDNKLGTGALFLIVFVLLGVGAGFRNVYVLVRKQFEVKDEDNDAGNEDAGQK